MPDRMSFTRRQHTMESMIADSADIKGAIDTNVYVAESFNKNQQGI